MGMANPVAMQNAMLARSSLMAGVSSAAHARYIAGLNARSAASQATQRAARKISDAGDALSPR